MIDSAIYHLNLHKRIIDSLNNEIETDNAAAIKANVELRYKANEQLERKFGKYLRPYRRLHGCRGSRS